MSGDSLQKIGPPDDRTSPTLTMKVGPTVDPDGAYQNEPCNGVRNDQLPVLEVQHNGGRAVREESHDDHYNIGMRYARFMVRFPSVILILVFIGVVVAGALGVVLNKFPSFEDPTQGFEARGTVISGRLKTFERVFGGFDGTLDQIYSCPPATNSSQSVDDVCSSRQRRQVNNDSIYEAETCSNALSRRLRIAYQSTGSTNMFTSDAMKAVCQHDNENLRIAEGYDQFCYYFYTENGCCPSWSLGHVTALMAGKESCDEIEDEDVLMMKQLLKECVGFYSEGCLVGDGDEVEGCSAIPRNCSVYSGVHTIFHYLTPTDFADGVAEGVFDLRTTMVFHPIYRWQEEARTVYELYEKSPKVTSEGVRIVAIGGAFKFDLFADYLLSDSIYIGIGCLAVLIIIWIYVGSFFVTIMTILSIIMSMVVSYFIYHTIFRLVFFPFINVITAVLLIGVGADDCFVYVDIWKLTKKDHGGGHANLVPVLHETLKHAATTMFVTSFTTSSALFAGCVSSITAVRCFSVFAGTSILVNLVLTLTWIPAAVMIHEKYFICDESAEGGSCKCCGCWFSFGRLYDRVGRIGSRFFEEYLPIAILKLRFLWIFLLSGLGIGGFCVVFVSPRLRLPTQSEFQVFRTSHALEQYDQVFKDTFAFESESGNKIRAYILWGVEALDNGNHWDPESFGNTVLDRTFDVTSPESQEWLFDFCSDLRNASFHDTMAEAEDEFCFIDVFKNFMEGPCQGDLFPCCNQADFPYSSSLFSQCVPVFYRLACQSFGSCTNYIPGMWFNLDNEVVGMSLFVMTNQQPSLNYNRMGKFWSDINGFVKRKMTEAPPGLRKGWFISVAGLQMGFYDLQHGLATGTPISVGVSLALAACVLLITIRNVLVTLFAMYSIACAVFVVIASVVLLGWELNIFESTVLSLAVGLSVDFTIHLGVAYRQATAPDRISRTLHALRTLVAAITLAALTTFVAGACMLPATVLSYVQLGTFLMIVMAVSWVYGVFLFISLCRTIGPQGMFAQISRSCCRRDQNIPNANLEMKPGEHAHEQHVDTSDERIET